MCKWQLPNILIMENFDLRKYLAENKLLKEGIDPNSEIADYVSAMYDSEDKKGIQSGIWSQVEYAATSPSMVDPEGELIPGEGSVFMDLVDHLKEVGGKDVLEGNPVIELKLLDNEDIQWRIPIDIFLNDNFDKVKEKIENIPSEFKIMGDLKVATAADGERGIDISFDEEHMLSKFPKEDPFNEVESIEIAGQTVYYNDYL